MFCIKQSTELPLLTASSSVADVVRVLSLHDPNQVEAAAKMIKEQCYAFPAKRVAYAAALAIPALVNALRTHPDHVGVQDWVCRALWNICFESEGNQVRFSLSI